jgi:transposase
MTPSLTLEQRSDAVVLVENGHSTAAVAQMFGVTRRRIQQIVSDATAASDEEIAAAREAYKVLAAQRGERVPPTEAEKRALIDGMFADSPEGLFDL